MMKFLLSLEVETGEANWRRDLDSLNALAAIFTDRHTDKVAVTSIALDLNVDEQSEEEWETVKMEDDSSPLIMMVRNALYAGGFSQDDANQAIASLAKAGIFYKRVKTT